MENPEIRRRKIKQDRRKEKGERERTDSTAPDGERESPPVKKRKVRKSAAYEDVIDGFAIRSFKTYEDLQRAVALESGQQPQTVNESQESGGARISGSGGSGDNSKVGANESPSKESGKSSASTKSPKSKKKKLSTTDQENNASVMQPDLSRCSGESGDHGSGNVPPGPGNVLEAGMSQSLNTSHSHTHPPHSFSQHFQQQQQPHFPLSEPVTALKPHPQQHPKKVRAGKDVRKIHICKMEDGGIDVSSKKADDHKEIFAAARKDLLGKADALDNLHRHSAQIVKVAETSTQHSVPLLGELTGNHRDNSICTSTSTSIDHSQKAPTSPLHAAASSTTVATQFSSVAAHFQNHQKTNSAPLRVPGFGHPADVGDHRVNSVTVKSEPRDPSPSTADIKSFTNGPLSPTKRQLEVNGRNHHHPYLPQPVIPDGSVEGATLLQQSSHNSHAAFTPISQSSPKSPNSVSFHPAQQQVVAPVSNPKEKFGQGRIGSQTLFTPYATTAITRVRSPLGGGGPPPVSSVCNSGSQSSVTTVIQPESPRELTPIGSPYLSVPPHHHHHHHQQSPHHHHNQQQTPPPPHLNNVKNNQHHHYNNRIKGYNPLPVGSHYTTSVNSSANNYHHHSTTDKNSKPPPHSANSSSTKAYPAQHNPGDYPNSVSTGTVGRPPVENCQRKDHSNLETSEYKNRPNLPTPGSRSALSAPNHNHKVPPSASKDKVPVVPNKSNAALAFGSIARLLDSPASSSSSSNNNPPASIKSSIPQHHHLQQHQNHNHHHHPHPQHHTYNHSNPNSYLGVPHHHSKAAGSVPVSGGTQSLQHPGTSSSAGSNSSVSTIPVGTIGFASSASSSSNQREGLSGNQSNSLATSASTQSCSSRSHSPRGHSPTRERDSYSSNVSSLSRSSATPVSGSQPSSHLSLPPNLSPQLQSSSYSKAVSWLSTVPGLSPVPRPTPPPPTSSISGHHPGSVVGTISGPLSLHPSSVASPFGGYPGVNPPHSLQSPHPGSAANMFTPPILPLSSISAHPASQPPTFGPGAESLYPGPTTSDMVRRDLESKLISGDRTVTGGPSPFLTRPSDLHPHHSLLPPLSGVGHLSHNPGAPPSAHPSPHSALFPPPLFKDLPKVGIDSPFYRTSMGLSYPGFNGILPPPGLATPFAPPTQLPTYTKKKTGKWNAMHVRIAWEIYQHQQRGGSTEKSGSSSSASSSSSKTANPASSAASAGGAGEISRSTPPVVATSAGPPTSLAVDLLRSSSHGFTGLGRAGEAPPPFSAPMLSPHVPPHASPRGTPYDPLFLNSAASHLGPPLPRYPGFGALGPSFGGALSGLGSSLLGRDLSSLVGLGPGQDQWARFARPPFPGASSSLGANWQVQRLEQRDSKTLTESRRQKESEERDRSSRHSDSRESRGGRDPSPFRDRSPIRPARTPQENGDGDSRSSRSNDSQGNSASAVHSHSKSSGGRSKEESLSSNGERDKASTPILSAYDRERIAQSAEKSVPSHAASHPLRIYPPSSPLNSTMPGMSAWDAFPGFLGAAPRMSLSLLQLSERERELARIPTSGRSALFSNGPYGPLPLGVLGGAGPLSSVPPGSTATTASGTSKSSPLEGPIPLLNASIPPSPVSHSHHHSSQQQNGPNSPSAGKTQNQSEESKQLPLPPTGHGGRTKEESSSHQSR